jgi:hypothetical protein
MAAGFLDKYLSEVESGKGLIGGAKEAGKGTIKDLRKSLSKQGLKETAVRTFFGGDDILSAYMRGKFGVKKKDRKEKAPSPESAGGGEGISADGVTFLKIIGKNSMSLPGIARDMNVLRQNVVKLVKLKDKNEARLGADAFFLKEDERERALEAQKEKMGGQKVTPAAGAGGDEGGFLSNIIQFFSQNFTGAIKSLFSPKMLGSILKKVFLPIAIIGTLFSGIMDGWKRYQETGNLGDAVVAGLGGALKFLTFGLFDEESLKSLWSSVSDFMSPITDTISGIFTGIKNFFLKLFGKDVPVEDTSPPKIDAPKPEMPDPKQFATDAAKASGASDEKAQDLGSIFESVSKGDSKGLFEKAKSFAEKYPEPAASESSPSAQGAATSEPAAAAMPSPTPATPSATGGDSPMVEKHRKLAKEFSMGNATTPQGIAQEIDYVKTKRDYYAANRDKAMELGLIDRFGEYDRIVDIYNNRINELLDMQQGKKSPSAVTGGEPQMPAAAAGGGASPSVSAGGGGGGGGGGAAPASGASPSAEGGGAAPSGAEMSAASSQVAEGQRMESSADMGGVINSPTTNNSSSAPGKEPAVIADAYDSEFAKLLAAA